MAQGAGHKAYGEQIRARNPLPSALPLEPYADTFSPLNILSANKYLSEVI